MDWADNPTVTALYNQVKNQPIEIKARAYALMEKVGKLPETLPSSNE
ncbi:cyclophilin-like fold protein [Streptococcus anginosus]